MIDRIIPVEFPTAVYAAAAPNSDGSWNVYINAKHPEGVRVDAVQEMERRIARADRREVAV